jgi:enoyl-CoA hydratase/carnithine racemase
MTDIWADNEGQSPAILTEVREGVGIVTLNRPSKLNAWTPAMGSLYFDTLDRFSTDPDVRAILVRGEGRGFCAGADMSGLQGLTETGGYGQARDPRRYWWPMSIGKPIVAAIHGACYGVGLQQALVCDVRFAAHDVKLCAPYVKRGLIGEVGVVWMLTRIVGAGNAMDMMLSGRPLSGEEALGIGLVNKLYPAEELFDRALDYCLAMAEQCSPWSLRMIKQQAYHALMENFTSAFEDSEVMLQTALNGADFAEGISAFRDKRQLNFPPLSRELSKLEPWPG